MPLPLYRRHLLTLDARARDLAGAPAGERVLRVGRLLLAPLARGADRPETDCRRLSVPAAGAVFVEPLRGFEDYPFAVDRIAIGSATYRLPFIIDHGWASTLGLLPALFIRQLNLDLFAVAATDGTVRRPPQRRRRLAVAAAGVLGRADHAAVPARPPVHGRSRAGATVMIRSDGPSIFGWNSALV